MRICPTITWDVTCPAILDRSTSPKRWTVIWDEPWKRAIRALTSVSEHTDIACVPSIRRANDEGHAIGLGQMNLHWLLARESIMYGSPEALDFTDMYFMTVAYHAYRASHELAVERGTRL